MSGNSKTVFAICIAVSLFLLFVLYYLYSKPANNYQLVINNQSGRLIEVFRLEGGQPQHALRVENIDTGTQRHINYNLSKGPLRFYLQQGLNQIDAIILKDMRQPKGSGIELLIKPKNQVLLNYRD